ncbi:hypothetical protein BDZ85DRAFT_136569 [Elsinoe ampelina]|uniref:Uncharacterized protein n=1 Tax=Elsinoe ampelina TaxID=302913 RepID=A0A6A6G8Z0_9PEZI|nr:hypothetical protein BDZ85DRAFT_136569 [Elsinoe ampelina]
MELPYAISSVAPHFESGYARSTGSCRSLHTVPQNPVRLEISQSTLLPMATRIDSCAAKAFKFCPRPVVWPPNIPARTPDRLPARHTILLACSLRASDVPKHGNGGRNQALLLPKNLWALFSPTCRTVHHLQIHFPDILLLQSRPALQTLEVLGSLRPNLAHFR